MNEVRSGERGGAIATLLLGVIAVIGILLVFAPKAKKSEPEDPLAGLRHACREFIGRSLHDPSSADYGDYWNWTAVDNHDGTWSVGAQFRAKNGYGSDRQAYTTCIIRKQGGNYELQQLSRIR